MKKIHKILIIKAKFIDKILYYDIFIMLIFASVVWQIIFGQKEVELSPKNPVGKMAIENENELIRPNFLPYETLAFKREPSKTGHCGKMFMRGNV